MPEPIVQSAAEARELQRWLLTYGSIERFDAFFRVFWEVIEPGTPLHWNWHLDVLCDAVQRQVDGDLAYRRLLVLMPPGFMKSVTFSVMRPAWVWLRKPWRRSIYFSHSESLAERDSRRTRDIIEHPAYKQAVEFAVAAKRLKRHWTLKDDQNRTVNFANTEMGFRLCYGITSKWTGARGDDIVIDDAVDAGDVVIGAPAQVEERLREARFLIHNKMQDRVNDKKTATWTLVQQRLDERDPAGDALKDGDWKVIKIPHEFDPSDRQPGDPRTVAGELICPAWEDESEVLRVKRKMDPRHWEAQHNQNPIAAVGGLFAPSVLAEAPRYADDPEERAKDASEVVLSIDCTFKKTADSDRVAMQVWARKGWGRRTLLDRSTKRMTFLETLNEAARLQRRWGATATLVEDKANGPAVIEALQDAVPGLIAITPVGSKYERAQVGSASLYAGRQIELPDRARYPWISEFEAAHLTFKAGGTDDDDIDAESQVHAWWNQRARQAPWVDCEAPGVVVRIGEPAFSTPTGSGRHYLHTASALLGRVGGFFVGVVPPATSAPDAGNVGCAVVMTAHGEVLGHVEAPRCDELASGLYAMCASLLTRVGKERDGMRAVRVRLVGGELAEMMERALRDYGFSILTVSAQSTAWMPKPAALASAAALGRDMAGDGRLRFFDPKLATLAASVTLDDGVPETPRIRLVEHRFLRKPVGKDALLVALMAVVDKVGADAASLARAVAVEERKPRTSTDILREHLRRNYSESVAAPKTGLWSALSPARR